MCPPPIPPPLWCGGVGHFRKPPCPPPLHDLRLCTLHLLTAHTLLSSRPPLGIAMDFHRGPEHHTTSAPSVFTDEFLGGHTLMRLLWLLVRRLVFFICFSNVSFFLLLGLCLSLNGRYTERAPIGISCAPSNEPVHLLIFTSIKFFFHPITFMCRLIKVPASKLIQSKNDLLKKKSLLYNSWEINRKSVKFRM